MFRTWLCPSSVSSLLIHSTALVSQGYSVRVTAAEQLVYIRFYVFASLCYSFYCRVATFIRDLFLHFFTVLDVNFADDGHGQVLNVKTFY